MEATEELDEELSGSPLWNPDLAPTPPSRRTWSTYNIAALWIGMAVVITTYTLASGLMEQGMTWYQALFTILLGNVIVLLPMILNAHAGTKYGISFPVLVPREFRCKRGERRCDAARDRRLWMVRHPDMDRRSRTRCIHKAMYPAGPDRIVYRDFIQRFLAHSGLHHSEGNRRHQGSRELVCAAAARRRIRSSGVGDKNGGGLGAILRGSAKLQKGATPFWTLFPAALTANVGYWATLSLNIPDFTRYAKSQRSQALGQALGLPGTMALFAFIGVAVTSATIVIFGKAIWDPVELISANRLAHRDYVRRADCSRRTAHHEHGGQCRIACERFLQPEPEAHQLCHRRTDNRCDRNSDDAVEALLRRGAYIFTWLIGYSSLMGALGGILIADYWVMRRQQLDLGIFSVRMAATPISTVLTGGRSRRLSLLAPVVPGFIRAATTPGGQIANPTILRPALHLRLVRDVHPQLRFILC